MEKVEWYIHRMEYYSADKEGANTICSNMGGPRDHHTKRYKPIRERQISYDFTYIWTLKKMIQMNLLVKQKHTPRHRKHICGYKGEREVGRGKLGAWD